MQIKYDSIPKVLIMGNGINRAYDFASWDELIESIRTKELTDAEKKSMLFYENMEVVRNGEQK